jgi:predicted AlkP superfamily pyrophosphatase or phosphodiesterase
MLKLRSLRSHFVLIAMLALALGGSCHRLSPREIGTAESTITSTADTTPPRLIWLTLDALQKANLAPYVSQIQNPHPRGLKWILDHQRANDRLQVSFPSITASSHITTLTCAASGQHGVFLNGGNWNGERDLNGFAMPYKTETWVQALRDDDKRVAVAAYPSVDGSSESRSGDMGIAYDSPKGRVQYIKLAKGTESIVELPSHQTPDKKYKVALLWSDGEQVKVSGDFPLTDALPVGLAVDSFANDGEGDSLRKAQVTYLHLGFQGPDNSIIVAVSPVSVMPVTGDVLRSRLDGQNIVWSNIRDYGYAKYNGGVALTLETIKHRRNKAMAAIRAMLSIGGSDAYFLYLEDIDVLLHGWIGAPEVEGELVAFLSEFDRELGELIATLPPTTNLVVMGDHGMSAINYELNARKLIPEGLAQYVQVRTSGGTMLLYPAGQLDAAVPQGFNIEQVAERLRSLKVEFDGNRPLFSKVVTRDSDEARSMGLSGPSSPWIMAFAHDGIAIQDKIDPNLLIARRATFMVPEELREKYPDPMNSGILIQPTPLGAHGHDSTLPSMRTHLFAVGPDLDTLDLSDIKTNLHVVPAIADALGWPRPESCR